MGVWPFTSLALTAAASALALWVYLRWRFEYLGPPTSAKERPHPTEHASAQASTLDPPSMGEIYALTPYIAQVLKSRGVPQSDREDLIQRVLLGAWQAIAAGRFRRDPDIPLRAWVAEIARRQASNYWRASRSRQEELTDPDLIQHESPQAQPDEALADKEDRLFVADQLAAPDEMQAILVDHDLEGLAMADIARDRSVPLSTAYRWRASALEGLRERWRRRK